MERPIVLGSGVEFYGTVRVKLAVWTSVPEVPVTMIVEVIGAAAGVEEPQPLSMDRLTTLMTARSNICKRRRFLKPNMHSARANVTPGTIGPNGLRTLAPSGT